VLDVERVGLAVELGSVSDGVGVEGGGGGGGGHFDDDASVNAPSRLPKTIGADSTDLIGAR
jgi:hypothetical protein